MASLQELTDKVNELGAKVGEQTALITQVRTYVSGIEAQVRDLSTGEVLSATVQAKVDALAESVAAASAAIGTNAAALAAAGDGDINT